jgi:hypothetical protein
MMRARSKMFLGEDGPKKICVPKDGYWAGRRWGQRIDGAWVENILKEKMGQEKNVSLKMNSDEDE